jgi:hypothetical protein
VHKGFRVNKVLPVNAGQSDRPGSRVRKATRAIKVIPVLQGSRVFQANKGFRVSQGQRDRPGNQVRKEIREIQARGPI